MITRKEAKQLRQLAKEAKYELTGDMRALCPFARDKYGFLYYVETQAELLVLVGEPRGGFAQLMPDGTVQKSGEGIAIVREHDFLVEVYERKDMLTLAQVEKILDIPTGPAKSRLDAWKSYYLTSNYVSKKAVRKALKHVMLDSQLAERKLVALAYMRVHL